MREIPLADFPDEHYFTIELGSPDTGHGRAAGPRVCMSLGEAGDMWGNGVGARNRRALFASIGVEEQRVHSARQVHSQRVIVVGPSEAPTARTDEADGLLTVDENAILSVLVADCYPIFLFDRGTGAFAALHSGWRGTGISCAALSLMRKRYGTRAANVNAFIGPGIGPCCYDVPEERAQLFAAQFGSEHVEQREERWFLDLRQANVHLLRERGVDRVTSIPDCTKCNPRLGSFRRQGPDEFTHMLALIGHFG